MDKRNSHSRNSKQRRDDSGLLKSSPKRNSHKSKILTKFKGSSKNYNGSSSNKFKKLYSDSLFDIKRKNSKRASKKSLNNKNKDKQSSSIMFSKFLRSMEMGDSPHLVKYRGQNKDRKYK